MSPHCSLRTYLRSEIECVHSSVVYYLNNIVELLKSSTIVEEKGKDIRLKFWTEYQKVSGDFDDNMLDWYNKNMDATLTFAGLFSGINTAFIMAMQPNPLDTNNALLVLLIQITLDGPSAAQSKSLSSSTNYPPIFWMQVLAYMSLAFSLLAAFSAVMCKQWLTFYKAHHYGDPGSLEERCKQRHDEFQKMGVWEFHHMPRVFADLLKTSLCMFGVSLAGWMWTLQRTISILIILVMTFGFLCYVIAILPSVIHPNYPFQTRLTLIIRVCLFGNRRPSTESFIVPAMDWMLKTSTRPDAIRAALDLLSDMPSFGSYVGVKKLCENVLHMFERCFSSGDAPILNDARAYGTALIKFSRKHPKAMDGLQDTERWWRFWKLWHSDTEYLSLTVDKCRNSYENMKGPWECDYPFHEDKLCTTMQMVVPNNVGWIWGATFEPECDLKKASLFKSITFHFIKSQNFEAAGDAFILFNAFGGHDLQPRDLISFFQHGKLLHGALCVALRVTRNNPAITYDSIFQDAVVKAICPTNDKDNQFTNANRLLNFPKWPEDGYSHLADSPLSDIQCMLLLVLPTPLLDNPADYFSFCSTLIFHLRSKKSKDSKLKPIALRRACQLGQELATMDAEGLNTSIQNILLSQLFPTLLEVVHADSSNRNDYLCLMFALANSPSWLPRLHKDSLIKWCISISLELQKLESPGPYSFYPFGILLRIQLAHPGQAAFRAIENYHWWNIMKMAWHGASRANDSQHVLKDVIENFGELVKGTKKHLPCEVEELRSFLECLGNARANTQLGREAKDEVDLLEREVRRRLPPPPLPPV